MLHQITAIVGFNLKISVRDRFFHGILLSASGLVFFAYLLSTLTVVETNKVLLDFGFSAVSFSSIIIAIFVGIQSVRREIDNRQIYNILTKPISRRLYLLSKAIAGALVNLIAIAMLCAILTIIMLTVNEPLPAGYFTVFYLIFLESMLTLFVAIAFSVLSSSAPLATSFAGLTFVLGRSSNFFPTIAERSESAIAKGIFTGLYYMVPNLDRYNIRDVVAYNKPFDSEIPWICTVYAFLFCTAVLMIAWSFFERKSVN